MNENNPTSGETSRPFPAHAKYLSGGDVEIVVALLCDLREQTLSRATYIAATRLIVELGGSHLLPNSSLATTSRD